MLCSNDQIVDESLLSQLQDVDQLQTSKAWLSFPADYFEVKEFLFVSLCFGQ